MPAVVVVSGEMEVSMSDLVCLGEVLIDLIPTVEKGRRLCQVSTFVRKAGGAPANVAAGFAKLGGSSSFVGKVGSDGFGEFLRDSLARAGVDLGSLYSTEEALTGLAFVSLLANGERDFLFYRRPAADMLLRQAEVPKDLLARCRIFHFGSVSLAVSPAREATLAAAAYASGRGKIVSFDPNLRPALWQNLVTARKYMLKGLAFANVLKVSIDELLFMTECRDRVSAIASLFREYRRLRLVATTLGGDGCLLSTAEETVALQGFPVQVVDTTGAGDGFTAGLLYAMNTGIARLGISAIDLDRIMSSEFLTSAGRFANAVGALVVTKKGGIPAMPDRATVDAFLARENEVDV